jgi:hypothetical protein
MRSDYALYVVAIICFGIALIAYLAPLTGVTELYLYGLAVLGIIFVGFGYMARPKGATVTPAKSPTAAASKELPPRQTSEIQAKPAEDSKKNTPRKRARKRSATRRRKKKT